MAEKDIQFVREEMDSASTASNTTPTLLPWPTVDVAPTLFVIQAKIYDPVKDADRTLPPHAWAIGAARAERDCIGPVSSDDGIASVPLGEEVARRDEFAWSLILLPFPKKTPEKFAQWKALYGLMGEVWLDLDANDWVFTTELQKVERRRLLRLPVWSTTLKSQSGGFSETPPNTPGFVKDGIFRKKEIVPYGTKKKPWELKLDHQWYRSYVSFKYYDVKRKTEQTGAPGLIVEALDNRQHRIGAGTSLDGRTGVAYVLHAATKEQAKEASYAFKTDASTFVDLAPEPAAAGAEPKTDTRMRQEATPSAEPGDRRMRVMLPVAWHSHGMEARKGAAARRAWDADLQKEAPDLTRAQPLYFHLDDTLLVDASGGSPKLVTLPVNDRVTIFDYRMAVKDPDVAAPHLTTAKVQRDSIRAEEQVFVAGKGIEDVTLVVNHEGTFHLLRERHVTGKPGQDRYVGARAAVHGEVPAIDFSGGAGSAYITKAGSGTYQLYLVPDAIADTWDGTDVELCHLVVYVAMKITKRVGGTDADIAKAAGALSEASLRWDELHPAHPGTSYTKDYRIVQKGGLTAKQRVVRLRHFFGTRTDGAEKFTLEVGTPPDANLAAQGRSYVQGSTLYMIPTAIGPSGGKVSDSDGVQLEWFTLSHELGHVIGLPDEYAELLRGPADVTISGNDPRLPRYEQSSDGKPFNIDNDAMMKYNELPRLRYQWHHAHFLNVNAAARAALHVAGATHYLSTYPAFRGGTTFELADHNAKDPWDVVATRSYKMCDLVLYKLGLDEGAREGMFGAIGTLLDGLLLVRTKFGFTFTNQAARVARHGGSIVDVARADLHDFATNDKRYDVMAQLHKDFFNAANRPSQRFVIQGGTRMKNVAILFQPHFAFQETPGGTQVHVEIVYDAVTPFPSDLLKAPGVITGSPPTVSTGIAHAGLSLQRFALGLATATGGVVSNGAFTAAELADLGAQLAPMLAEGGAPTVAVLT